MVRKGHRYQGFTIVELLVVIVVIAILATISGVAFNGIQKRAQTAQYTSNIDAAAKSIQAKRVLDSKAIVDAVAAHDDASALPGYVTFCLAKTADLPARDGFAAGQCYYDTSDGSETGMANDALFDELFGSPEAPFKSTVYPAVKMGTLSIRAPVMFLVANSAGIIDLTQWLPPDASSCGTGVNFVTAYIDLYDRVISGEITPEEAGLDGMTIAQVIEMRNALKDGPGMCMANLLIDD